MTYTFEFSRVDVEEGSEEHKKLEKNYIESSQMAVHMSIEALRKMAAAGELE